MMIADVPDGWKVKTEGIALSRTFWLKTGSKKLLCFKLCPTRPGAKGEVSFVQHILTLKTPTVMSGFTIALSPRKKQVDECKDAKCLDKLLPRLESSTRRREILLPQFDRYCVPCRRQYK